MTNTTTTTNAGAAETAPSAQHHTAGPWVVGYEPEIPNAAIIIHSLTPGNTVAHAAPCDASNGGTRARFSNAKLIASAPVLLIALEGILAALTQNATHPADVNYARNIARRAIAKATTSPA